jgi:hypothetical protein
MSLIIPITFATRTGELQLAYLDENFTYLKTQLDTSNTTITNILTQLTVLGSNTSVGDVLYVNDTTNRVGIKQSNPTVELDVNGAVKASSLALTTPLSTTSGGLGASTSAGVDGWLDNILPSGEQSTYVLTTSGRGTYFWGPSTGSGQGSTLSSVRQSFTASAGQTLFNLSSTYATGSGQLRVYVGGVRQYPEAYTETSTTSFTLSTGVSAGTLVFAEIDAFIANGLVAPIFTGTTTLQQSTEVLNTKTTATGTVTHDFSTGAIFYHSSISASFTANFTNVPETNNRTIVISLILAQGATPFIPNAVQIGGVAQTIKWQDNTVPTGNASKVDIASFSLIRTGSAWTVLGGLSTYG